MQTRESGQFKGQETNLLKEVSMSDLEMITVEGFEKRYLKHLETCRTCEEAYDKAAKDFRNLFKKEKYSSWNSFRNVKNRRLKSR